MWKTLYDMCTGSTEEQQLYHSISTVATLLLQIGEVAKQYKKKPALCDSHGQSSTAQHGEATTHHEPVEIPPHSSVPVRDEQDSVGEDNSVGGCEKATPNQTGVLGNLTPVNHDPLLFSDDNEVDSECDSVIQELEACHLKAEPKQEVVTKERSEHELLDKSNKESKPDPDWSVNFEQFLASMLTEPHLVAVFEKESNIIKIVNNYRQRRLKPSKDDYYYSGSSSTTPTSGR